MFATARKLNCTQWRYLLASAVLLPLVNAVLIGRGIEKTRKTLGCFSGIYAKKNKAYEEMTIRDIVLALGIAARRLPGNTSCLRQALLAEFFLKRLGAPCELHFGVRKLESGLLEAHAWLTHKGQVVVGGAASDSQYVEMPPIRSAQS
jgi:Transglutaminase-like superfamily